MSFVRIEMYDDAIPEIIPIIRPLKSNREIYNDIIARSQLFMDFT